MNDSSSLAPLDEPVALNLVYGDLLDEAFLQKHGITDVAFATNTDGVNTTGFGSKVDNKFAPNISDTPPFAELGGLGLGDVVSKILSDGRMYHAVCTSERLDVGPAGPAPQDWELSPDAVGMGLDQVATTMGTTQLVGDVKRRLALVFMGTGDAGQLNLASAPQIAIAIARHAPKDHLVVVKAPDVGTAGKSATLKAPLHAPGAPGSKPLPVAEAVPVN